MRESLICHFVTGVSDSASLFEILPNKLKSQNPLLLEPRREKTGLRVSDQVRHKPSCTVTEAGSRLKILAISRRGTVLSM